MCNGIAIIVVKRNDDEIKVYCDPANGSHDKLLSENVPVEYHNSYIKVEYIFPGELRLDCPDEECRKAATATGLVDEIFSNVLRITPRIIEIIAKNMPRIESWPKELMQDANLQYANLRNVDLWNADLQDANLQDANLQYANLRNANLRNANLQDANLRNANLRDANLQYANLQDANLRNANLRDANLQYANLRDANLQYANLRNVDLWNANLLNANLQGANLLNADLLGANLQGANFPEPVGGKFDPAKIKKYREKLGIIINEVI